MSAKYNRLWPAAFWLLGLSLPHYFPFLRPEKKLFLLILALLGGLLFYYRPKIVFLAGAALFLAWWRYSLLWPADLSGRIENYYGQEFEIIARVATEAEIKDERQKIEAEIAYGLDLSGRLFKLRGRLLVFSPKYPSYHYDDLIKIRGQYLEPGMIEDFDYSLYLKRYGLTAVTYYPEISRLDSSAWADFEPNRIRSQIYRLRRLWSARYDYYLSFSSAAFIKALILNDRDSVSSELQADFSRSGLSHIVAISGMHVSLLSALSFSCLLLFFSRPLSFGLISLLLVFYLLLSGSPASAVRAVLMAILSNGALCFGRAVDLNRILFLVAGLMLFINPLLLWADIGFVLSFLAVLAIIHIHPIISFYLLYYLKPNKIGRCLVEWLSLTLSAQLITAPVLLSSFKQLSLVAPFSNVAVVGLLPLIMVLSLLGLFFSFFFPALAQLLFLVLDYLSRYVLIVNHWAAGMPGGYITVKHWPIFMSGLYYLLLLFFYLKLKTKNRDKLP